MSAWSEVVHGLGSALRRPLHLWRTSMSLRVVMSTLALSLVVVMTSLAVLYLLLGAEFLAVAQVIVYSGAIMVLFVFVVMMLSSGPRSMQREKRWLMSIISRLPDFSAADASAFGAFCLEFFVGYLAQVAFFDACQNKP